MSETETLELRQAAFLMIPEECQVDHFEVEAGGDTHTEDNLYSRVLFNPVIQAAFKALIAK